MRKTLFWLAAAAFLLALTFGCKTAPEAVEQPPVEQPKEQPAVPEKPPEQAPKVVEKPPEEKPPEVKPAPVSDEEVGQARAAIARAREADADYYDPQTLKAAEDALNAALRTRQSDPDTARK
jgi:outer membrane biosynthesis protein TonB